MKISCVIPCYHSQHTLGDVVAEIGKTMAARPENEDRRAGRT